MGLTTHHSIHYVVTSHSLSWWHHYNPCTCMHPSDTFNWTVVGPAVCVCNMHNFWCNLKQKRHQPAKWTIKCVDFANGLQNTHLDIKTNWPDFTHLDSSKMGFWFQIIPQQIYDSMYGSVSYTMHSTAAKEKTQKHALGWKSLCVPARKESASREWSWLLHGSTHPCWEPEKQTA